MITSSFLRRRGRIRKCSVLFEHMYAAAGHGLRMSDVSWDLTAHTVQISNCGKSVMYVLNSDLSLLK